MTTTFTRIHAVTAIAADLEEKLEFLTQPAADDLRTSLLIGDEITLAHASAKAALKHLLAATQMAANAEWARGIYAQLSNPNVNLVE
jgi:hypothetical protein